MRPPVLPLRARPRFDSHLARLDLAVRPAGPAPVTAGELEALPEPARRYLHWMGVVGRPRDWSFRARFEGQFRMKPGQPWMPFHAWQYNAADPVSRIIDMRIDVARLVPMFGTDTYLAGKGRMHGKVLGLVTVADGAGPEFDLGELVTYVNDAVMLAPSMLLTPATRWEPVGGDDAFDIVFTDAGNTVTARVFVDGAGRLVDFRTEDRWFAGEDPPRRTPWRTPTEGWTSLPDRRPVPTGGTAVWERPDGEFAYVRGRWEPDTIEFNIVPAVAAKRDRSAA